MNAQARAIAMPAGKCGCQKQDVAFVHSARLLVGRPCQMQIRVIDATLRMTLDYPALSTGFPMLLIPPEGSLWSHGC